MLRSLILAFAAFLVLISLAAGIQYAAAALIVACIPVLFVMFLCRFW